MYALEKISITPNEIPPNIAPGIDPIPPKTAAVKALMPGITPVVGVSVGYAEHNNTPAIAASPEPMANVSDIVALTFIPIRLAAALFSEQARIALPIFVFAVYAVNATIITIHEIIVVIVTADMGIPKNLKVCVPTTDGNTSGFGLHNSNAAFCKK